MKVLQYALEIRENIEQEEAEETENFPQEKSELVFKNKHEIKYRMFKLVKKN
jgi:hypothetical protein